MSWGDSGGLVSRDCSGKNKIDDLPKSLKPVTPAKAGVQNLLILQDSRFRGNDRIFILLPSRFWSIKK
jgi:hypothetical protein